MDRFIILNLIRERDVYAKKEKGKGGQQQQ